jgi:hypothetical protein
MSVIKRKYGVALSGVKKIRIPMLKAGSSDYATDSDWTPAAGDVKVSKDAGAEANIATLPSYTNGAWEFVLSATEMTAAQTVVKIVDSATKAVKDQFFIVETYGHQSAMWQPDMEGTELILQKYNGGVWLTSGGASGQVLGVNGTAQNPSGNWNDAILLTGVSKTGLGKIYLVGDTPPVVDQDISRLEIIGTHDFITLNFASGTKILTKSIVRNCKVTGTLAAASQYNKFINCEMGATISNLDNADLIRCKVSGLSIADGKEVRMLHCYGNAGTVNFNTPSSATRLLMYNCDFAELNLTNMNTFVTIYALGKGILDLNSTASAVVVYLWGNWRTINEGSASIFNESNIGEDGAGLTNLGGMNSAMKAEVNAEVDTALSDYDPPTHAEMTAEHNVLEGEHVTLGAQNTAIEVDTQDIQSRIPAALQSGRMKSNVDAFGGASTVDGVVLSTWAELMQAMVNGRFKKDTPTTGQITIYKRDNTTPLTIVNVTDTERTRIS